MKIPTSSLSLFEKTITDASTISIFGHVHIDGDCIGSMLSLGGILESLGKTVHYYTPLAPDSSFERVPGIDKIQTQMDYSRKSNLHIFVDFSILKRIPGLSEGHEEHFQSIPTIVIDHHHGDNSRATLSIKDVDAPSCCQRLIQLYEQMKWTSYITPAMATALYLGIVMDTGNFMFDGNTAQTLTAAAQTIHRGAAKNDVVYHMFRSRSFAGMRFVQKILDRLSIYEDTILWSYFEITEIENAGLTVSDVEYAQFIIQQIAGFPLTIMFKVYPDSIKISFRSRDPDVNQGIQPILANEVATLFGGGGHSYAAGAKVTRSHQTVIDQINTILKSIQ